MSKKRVSVIGSGGWGTAIALLLLDNGHEVTLWSWQEEESARLRQDLENKEFLPGVPLSAEICYTSDLCAACTNQDVIVTALPSHAIRQNAKKMRAYISQGQILLNISKGLEPQTLKRISEIFAEEIPQATVAVLSGPSHAEEVARKIPTTNVVASRDVDASNFIQDVFMNDYFRVYLNPDIIGVELGGALKNVIALCAGIVDGLGYGDNTKAALMTRGMAEIIRLGTAMGANPATFNGLTGMGDLIVTCTSMHSRNRRAGILIGQGVAVEQALESVHMVVEGYVTARAAYEMAQKYNVEMPIVEQAYRVLYESYNPRDAILQLMPRDKKSE